jgi:hypothetical protein
LREHDDADRQGDQAGQVEDDDAACETRRTLRDEKLPATLEPLADGGNAVAARLILVATGTLGAALGLIFDG